MLVCVALKMQGSSLAEDAVTEPGQEKQHEGLKQAVTQLTGLKPD